MLAEMSPNATLLLSSPRSQGRGIFGVFDQFLQHLTLLASIRRIYAMDVIGIYDMLVVLNMNMNPFIVGVSVT